MSFVDKSIKCSDCGATFTFSASEQELFSSEAIPTIPSAAHYAAQPEEPRATAFRAMVSPGGRCSQQCAPSAVRKQNYPLSRERAVLCTAAIATAKSNQTACESDRNGQRTGKTTLCCSYQGIALSEKSAFTRERGQDGYQCGQFSP
jgi:hypothetical protein